MSGAGRTVESLGATAGAAPIGVRAAGDRALLAEYADLADVLAHHQHLRAHPLDGQREAVAAARTILLCFDAPSSAAAARERLARLRVAGFSAAEARVVELDVVYDGEDLDEVAAAVSMSREALIAWHAGQEWTGAFGGFAPGFTYCTPADAAHALQVPRRETPRTALPAGSVALAAEFSAVYPRVSPGGWQLIGRTAAAMWDLDRAAAGESPALVRPGDVVRHRPVRELATLRPGSAADEAVQGRPDAATEPAALEVLDPGLQTLVQDLGREGLSDLGVSRAGVADEAAMRQANRLVGNTADAAVLEALQGGLRLQARRTVVLAVTGAEIGLRVDDGDGGDGGTRAPALRAPFAVTAGETLTLSAPRRGLRGVVAVRGGFAAEPVLGSVSADTMSGLGPAPLQAGDRLALADGALTPVGAEEPSTLPEPDEDGAITLRMISGPRDDWFDAAELERLQRQVWRVSTQADRIGVRLELGEEAGAADGEAEASAAASAGDDAPRPLRRARTGELPSEGVPRGALQVPPSGLPVLFLNDHPVTGGYPVIGVVLAADLTAAAQLAPGQHLRLRAVDGVDVPAARPSDPTTQDSP
ncbi:carboxyltransferase domain-containing protein [Nesterenkonia sp. F]|uniref:5-oxoprolinase subunit B/C family protein n=1 Tax=Nesterenkonia sp. F TaxID=795955 RepID=UPI000255D02F|nr:carboxyltransferase domain-containing protein [Nesterenkonia sp. F]